jgi:hypothetical protein
MPARGTDGIARPHDAWPDRIAFIDRLLQANVVVITRPYIAHRREPCVEHVTRILDARRHPETVGILQAVIAPDFGKAVQVNMHVDQAGQDRLALQENDLFLFLKHDTARLWRFNFGDAAIDHGDHRIGNDPSPQNIDHPVGNDGHGFCGCGYGHAQGDGGGENQVAHEEPHKLQTIALNA